MSIKDGGPAFPHSSIQDPGMTLRDYFAAKAMQSLIAKLPSEDCEAEMMAQGYKYGEVDKFVAKCAYDYSSAMLAEREKGGEA